MVEGFFGGNIWGPYDERLHFVITGQGTPGLNRLAVEEKKRKEAEEKQRKEAPQFRFESLKMALQAQLPTA